MDDGLVQNPSRRRAAAALVGGAVAAAYCAIDGAPSAAAPGVRIGSAMRSTWSGFDRHDFLVADRKGLIVVPRTAAAGNPWIWRTEFFGHEPQADIALLERGFHVAYLDVQNLYGAPAAIAAMDRFYDAVRATYSLADRVVLEGFSRGGLFAFNWATHRPGSVRAIYADAPVLDYKSWPLGKGRGKGSPGDWARLLQSYGLTEAEAMASQLSPVDRLKPLADAQIPLLHVCGAADDVVPFEENTGLLAKRYRAMGGEITVINKLNCGHHPHSLKDPARIVNWILKRTPGMEALATLPELTPYGYDYFKLRDGLGSSRTRFEAGGPVRVAFLGGSITASTGWRDQVCASLVRRFPRAQFEFVSAGIPSLDTTPNAFRMERDVLSRGRIDLLFVEAAVNDETNGRTAEEQIRGMEGIVRHARRSNPQVDLIHLHFVDPEKMAVIRGGGTPEVIKNHERVAGHYGCASIDLAWEVTDRIHAGEFTWEKDFKDLHPAPFGHQLYAKSVDRLLDAAWQEPQQRGAGAPVRTLKPPLDPANYSGGKLVSLDRAQLGKGWSKLSAWKPKDSAGTRPGFVGVPFLEATEPGSELSLEFDGTAVGLFITAGPDAGTIEFRIDGGVWQTRDTFTRWSRQLHLPWAQLLAAGLPSGAHRLDVRVSSNRNPSAVGSAVRVAHFLVNESE